MMDQSKGLHDMIRWQTKPEIYGATRLGKTLGELMKKRISPQQVRFGPVVELWDQLLPAELQRHCKIADISGGQLKVLVDSPSYLYELQLCSSELLEELQQQCPRARIRTIKFIVG